MERAHEIKFSLGDKWKDKSNVFNLHEVRQGTQGISFKTLCTFHNIDSN